MHDLVGYGAAGASQTLKALHNPPEEARHYGDSQVRSVETRVRGFAECH